MSTNRRVKIVTVRGAFVEAEVLKGIIECSVFTDGRLERNPHSF